MSDIIASDIQGEAVAQLLNDDERTWWTPSARDALERSEILRRFDHIKDANLAIVGKNSHEAAIMLHDYDESVAFVHDSFDAYESNTPSDERFDAAFLVPARGRHASEVTDFLPILDTEYGATPSQVHRTVAHLAPTKIETYRGTDDMSGMLVYVPAYFDMNRPRGRAQVEELYAAQRRVSEAAHFVRQRHQVGLAGLGAVLPAVTQWGTRINEEGLITTTGHGGTVHLISQAVEQAIELMPREPRVGMLGLGSIGGSSLDVLRASPLGGSIRHFRLYDDDETAVHRNARSESPIPTFKARSTRELLERSDIIVTAITSVIDLDQLELQTGRPLDLTGKIIVDDSQPGCFDREQVEVRGGKLVWVVGSDQSDSGFLHRNDGYTYGKETGLFGEDAVWGCEAEVGSLALLGKHELAVREKVTPKIAHEIGKVCFDAGVRAAWPPQSFGQPVEF